MSEEKEPKAEPTKKTKAEPAERIKLQHEMRANWTLRIDASEYQVTDGAVEVPAWHVDAAKQTGFR